MSSWEIIKVSRIWLTFVKGQKSNRLFLKRMFLHKDSKLARALYLIGWKWVNLHRGKTSHARKVPILKRLWSQKTKSHQNLIQDKNLSVSRIEQRVFKSKLKLKEIKAWLRLLSLTKMKRLQLWMFLLKDPSNSNSQGRKARLIKFKTPNKRFLTIKSFF